MPVIHSHNGAVIAWSGIQAGPMQEFLPTGGESPWVRYEAEGGTGAADTARITVRVQRSWRGHLSQLGFSLETVEREIVEGFIEERVSGNFQPLTPGAENSFSISEEQMLHRHQEQ